MGYLIIMDKISKREKSRMWIRKIIDILMIIRGVLLLGLLLYATWLPSKVIQDSSKYKIAGMGSYLTWGDIALPLIIIFVLFILLILTPKIGKFLFSNSLLRLVFLAMLVIIFLLFMSLFVYWQYNEGLFAPSIALDIKNGNLNSVIEYLNGGGDANKEFRINRNSNLMCYAIYNSRPDVFNALLQHGGNINNECNKNSDRLVSSSMLRAAVIQNEYEIVKTLLEHGANPNVYSTSIGLETVLDLAVGNQNATRNLESRDIAQKIESVLRVYGALTFHELKSKL